jgi:hypothetical protein
MFAAKSRRMVTSHKRVVSGRSREEFDMVFRHRRQKIEGKDEDFGVKSKKTRV